MIGVVAALVKVLINQFQLGILPGRGRSFQSLAVLGENECLCASILEDGMENRYLRVGFI